MGLLDSIESMVGGGNVRRLSAGQGNFESADSPDHEHFQNLVSSTDPNQTQSIFTRIAQKLNPAEYASHLTPTAASPGPLGNLGAGGLSTIASALMSRLMSGGYSHDSLLSKVAGLRTTDPNQMDAAQVAALAQYTQQNHPGIFGGVASLLGQQQPGLLSGFLGKTGLALGAAALASHFMKNG